MSISVIYKGILVYFGVGVEKSGGSLFTVSSLSDKLLVDRKA